MANRAALKITVVVLIVSTGAICRSALAQSPSFIATPLTDFATDQTYLGAFSGFLYDGSNAIPLGSRHDLDGRTFASAVQPLDINGLPDPQGKIVAVGLGMSNWTGELCNSFSVTSTTMPNCVPDSFIARADASPAKNPHLEIIDCAANSMTTFTWTSDAHGLYTRCAQILSNSGLSEKQVQVILWKDAEASPQASLTSTTNCATMTSTFSTTPDACIYEHFAAQVIRYVKSRYPNLQQMFLHSRIYAGYATTSLSPEPYAYEYGFATKWLIQAQIDEINSGTITPITGDLSYAAAPWLAWGPYFWADGTIPRSDGLTWLPSDFLSSDGTHPSIAGVGKVSSLMLPFYESSPYTTWFSQ